MPDIVTLNRSHDHKLCNFKH